MIGLYMLAGLSTFIVIAEWDYTPIPTTNNSRPADTVHVFANGMLLQSHSTGWTYPQWKKFTTVWI